MTFAGKKILFIAPRFFGYETAILRRLQELGAGVDYFDERPGNSVFSRGLIRLKSKLYQLFSDRYYQSLLEKIKGQEYDFFLLIKGETIPDFFLRKLREAFPKTVFVYYTYDSVQEYPRFTELFKHFDRNFSFDPCDAKRFSIRFRPLFSVESYEETPVAQAPKYHLVFVGTAHTDRYKVGEKVRAACLAKSLSANLYYYAPGKLTFKLRKIFDKNLHAFDLSKLSYAKLTHADIVDLYKDTVAVLDINKPFQKGLTIRTFEVLAAGKKLITTNADIEHYPFYNPESILIIDRHTPDLPSRFFKTGAGKLSPEKLEKLTLDSWLECLFFEAQDEYWTANRPK